MPCFHCHVAVKMSAAHSARGLATRKGWPNKVKRRLGIPVESRAEANRRTAVRAGNARPDAWGKRYPQCIEDWMRLAFEAEQKQWARHDAATRWTRDPQIAKELARARYYQDHELSKQRSRESARKTYQKRKNDPEWLQKRKKHSNAWNRRNTEYKRKKHLEWRKANPEAWRRSQQKQRQKPMSRIYENIRKRLRDVLRGKRAARAVVGCTKRELEIYLQSQFTKEMHWNNYGTYWHVDHIVPVSHFDLTNPEHCKLVHHYTNLRPMEAVANMRRGNRIEHSVQIRLPL
jgi:hypothetical protein